MFQDIAPHRFSNVFFKDAIHPEDVLLCYNGNHVLLQPVDEGDYALPRACQLPQQAAMEAIYLFSVDKTRYFGFWHPHTVGDVPGLSWQSTQVLRTVKDPVTLFAGMEGWHLYRWFRINRFCGHCGKPMELKGDERAVICPECGNVVYPRINPAIIVAVENQGKLLLARNASSPPGRYGLIAGFVEFGESLEDTVRREVREEVGLKVTDVQYYNSQPWPFSESLMLGFFARVEGDAQLHPDKKEIAEAKWVSPEELPPPVSRISIAQELMQEFKRRKMEE